jgi:hypothetical protein
LAQAVAQAGGQNLCLAWEFEMGCASCQRGEAETGVKRSDPDSAGDYGEEPEEPAPFLAMAVLEAGGETPR